MMTSIVSEESLAMDTHTHTDTHTHARTHSRTRTHAHTHTHGRTHAHAHPPPHTHTRVSSKKFLAKPLKKRERKKRQIVYYIVGQK